VLTDQQIIEQLRSELAALRPRSDLIEQLRDTSGAFHDNGDQREPEHRRSVRRHRPRVRLGMLLPIATAVVAIVIAVGALTLLHHRAGAPATTGKPAPQTGPSRPPAVTGSIHLRKRDVQSGRTVRGELVFENHTSKTKVLLRGCKADGLFAIEFRASDGYLQQPVNLLVACGPQELVAKPGTTIYRFKLPAAYIHCSQSARHQPPRSSKYWAPLCLKNSSGARDIMPPLPAGNYTALFFPVGEWHGPRVNPAELVVTRTR
jgi:hypothetical protein